MRIELQVAALALALCACAGAGAGGSSSGTSGTSSGSTDGTSGVSASGGTSMGSGGSSTGNGGDTGAGSSGSAAATSGSGGTTGSEVATQCNEIGSVGDACDGKPPYFWLCQGGSPPEDGCEHPDAASEPNADIEYCCPNAICVYEGGNFDYTCAATDPSRPHAWSCQDGATPPPDCVPVNSQIVSVCCP